MNNARLLKIIIALLIAVNIVTLSYIWLGKPGGHDGPPHGGKEVFGYLCRELQLTDEQQQQYARLRDEHHQAMNNIQEHAHSLREQFFNLLNSSPADTLHIRQLSDSIAATQKQIELVTFYHFQKVRAICTPEQQKKFDQVIQGALRMMAPPGPQK